MQVLRRPVETTVKNEHDGLNLRCPLYPLADIARLAILVRYGPIPVNSAGGLAPEAKPPALPTDRADTAYCSAVVLVKFPLTPLALIWLLPNEMRDPEEGIIPVPLPPIVDAPTLTTAPAELV
jgi:hypothetical protein